MKESQAQAPSGSLYVRDYEHVREIATQYAVPKNDILLMSLNLSGVQSGNIENDRGRFWVIMPNGQVHKVALTITTHEFTNFKHTGDKILLGDSEVGFTTPIEKDTCTDSYWRGNTHLTLNTNQRSFCKGCGFCGTYNLEHADDPLTDEKTLETKALAMAEETGGLNQLNTIGIVTGCFADEKLLVRNLKMVRRVFSRYGFCGEIQYVGSQLTNKESITELAQDGPFSLYLTIEVFSKRIELMKKQKSSLTLDSARDLLGYTKSIGANSSFLYIAGLDSLETYREELPKFRDVINRFPQIQTYQLYSPWQIAYREKEAFELDYFIKMRQVTEKILPNLIPVISHNYRGLWYTNYLGKQL